MSKNRDEHIKEHKDEDEKKVLEKRSKDVEKKRARLEQNNLKLTKLKKQVDFLNKRISSQEILSDLDDLDDP